MTGREISEKFRDLESRIAEDTQLGEQDLTSLARIVVVDPQDAAVQALNRAVQIEHSGVEVRESNLFGLPVKQASIITSKRPPAPAAA